MMNKVNVTMMEGSPKIAHKQRACNLIFNLTGMHDADEALSLAPGLIFSVV